TGAKVGKWGGRCKGRLQALTRRLQRAGSREQEAEEQLAEGRMQRAVFKNLCLNHGPNFNPVAIGAKSSNRRISNSISKFLNSQIRTFHPDSYRGQIFNPDSYRGQILKSHSPPL